MGELTETKAPIIGKPVLEHVGKDPEAQRLRVRGPSQRVGVKNENGRKYPESVWTTNLAEDSPFMRRLIARGVLGELEHPESGTTHLARVSHLVERAWREQLDEGNEYAVPEGDYILGEYLILNTPSGQILRELYECEIPVGVSSRGRGDVVVDGDGCEVVQDNYGLDTFDFVYQPSVEEARPMPTTPPAEEAAEVAPDLLKTSRGLAKQVSSALTERVNLVKLVELGSVVTERLQQLEQVDNSKYNNEELSTVTKLLKGCHSKLNEVVEKHERPQLSLKSAKPAPPIKHDEPTRRRVTVSDQTKVAELVAHLADRTVKAEALAGARPGRATEGASGSTRELQRVKRRYHTLMQFSESLLKRARKLLKEGKLSTKRYEAAVKLCHQLTERVKRTRVQRFVEAAVAEAPELAASKPLLLESKSVEEASKMIKSLTSATSIRTPSTVSPADSGVHIPAGRPIGESTARKPSGFMSRVVKRLDH